MILRLYLSFGFIFKGVEFYNRYKEPADVKKILFYSEFRLLASEFHALELESDLL